MAKKLERVLNLWQLTVIGIGIILGAGIYVLIGEATGIAGNAVWISFTLAALVSGFTGLSYAELSSLFPKSGAEYVYIQKIFSKRLAWLTGWLIILGGFMTTATVSIGFANYFHAIFGTPVVLIAAGLIALSGIVLFTGIKESALLTIVFTFLESIGLLIIIAAGFPYLGNVDYMEMANGMGGILEAGALIFFAFVGFETITRLSDETKDPRKTIPKALIISIVVTTIMYMLVAISSVSIMGWKELGMSESPMADIANRALGGPAFLLLSFIALFSTSNTALVMMLGTSRIIYGIAEFNSLPRVFLSISRKTHTPWASILITILASILFLFAGDLRTIANMTNFTIFVTFFLVNAAVIKMRVSKINSRKRKVFRIPFSINNVPIIPVLGALSCLFMMINTGSEALLYGFALTTLGLLVYEYREIEVNRAKLFGMSPENEK